MSRKSGIVVSCSLTAQVERFAVLRTAQRKESFVGGASALQKLVGVFGRVAEVAQGKARDDAGAVVAPMACDKDTLGLPKSRGDLFGHGGGKGANMLRRLGAVILKVNVEGFDAWKVRGGWMVLDGAENDGGEVESTKFQATRRLGPYEEVGGDLSNAFVSGAGDHLKL
jgi:hypothetical protein